MKEDLAIAKNTMITLVEENNQLKHALGKYILYTYTKIKKINTKHYIINREIYIKF